MPIPGDPYWENVSLLIPADAEVGTGTTPDFSPSSKTIVATGASALISSVSPKFGAGCLSVPSINNYWTIPDAFPGGLGNADFTFEGWVRVTAVTGATPILFSLGRAANNQSVVAGIHLTLQTLYVKTGGTGGSWTYQQALGLNLNDSEWHAFALTRVSTNLHLFIDGVLITTLNVGTAAVGEANLGYASFGGTVSAAASTFFIDEVRATQGIGRYTESYDPPTEPFPFLVDEHTRASAVAETILLTGTSSVSLYRVESIRSAQAETPADLYASAVGEVVLLADSIRGSEYRVESIRRDPGFSPPGDVTAAAVSDFVAVAIPLGAVQSEYSVESIRYGYSPVEGSTYYVETLRGLPYSVQNSRFAVEAIVASTIEPPQPQTEVRWFTIVNP